MRWSRLTAAVLTAALLISGAPCSVRAEAGAAESLPGIAEGESGGWQVQPDGSVQYYLDGAPVTGLQEIDGSRYYFDGQGMMQKQIWRTIDGAKYYFQSDGKAAVGSCKVDGQYYVFDLEGRRLSSAKLSITFLDNGKMYCVDKKGRPRKGWQVIRKKLYRVNARGEILTDTICEGIQLTSGGFAEKSTRASLKIKVLQVLDKITTKKMTKKEKLRKCFSYSISSQFHYNRAKWPDLKQKEWWRTCALNMLTQKQGVCFGYACAFAALAEELGYEPYLMDANLRSRHCWVRINGKYYDRLTGVFGAKVYPRQYSVIQIIKF